MVKDNSNLSPEKQLLKLIEDPHGVSGKGAVAHPRGVDLFSLGAFKGRLDFAREKLNSLVASWSGPLDIKKINNLLAGFAVLTGICFFVTFFVLMARFSVLPSFSFKAESAAKMEVLKQASQLKPLAAYMEKVGSRDIFKIGAKPAQEAGAQKDEMAQKAKQESVLAKYKLVGISWSDNPDAMVEDAEAHKTYFLKRGQVMSDGTRIQAIFKDKVVLNYSGMEVELR